jgi:hypothetical protein
MLRSEDIREARRVMEANKAGGKMVVVLDGHPPLRINVTPYRPIQNGCALRKGKTP